MTRRHSEPASKRGRHVCVRREAGSERDAAQLKGIHLQKRPRPRDPAIDDIVVRRLPDGSLEGAAEKSSREAETLG